MRLVLQCGMCGTHHAVGTAICATCRASGVAQLRLMFECETCGALGIDPTCGECAAREFDNDLAFAEELIEEPYTIDESERPEDVPLELDDDEIELIEDLDLGDDDELTEFDGDDEIHWDKH